MAGRLDRLSCTGYPQVIISKLAIPVELHNIFIDSCEQCLLGSYSGKLHNL